MSGRTQYRYLADTETEDQIRILTQNAKQILSIVKETFMDYPFDGHSVQRDCTLSHSEGDLLDCLWSQASKMLAAESLSAKPEALSALMEVSCMARIAPLWS